MADNLFSPINTADFYSFSADEAYGLVTSVGLPLDGECMPERSWWLEPEEAWIERFAFDDVNEELPEIREMHCWHVYDILETLFVAFDRVNVGQAISRADVEHAQTVAKRLRSLIKVLDDPKTQMIGGGKPMHDFLADCRAQAAKSSRWAKALDLRAANGGDQSLAEFIRGPLADAYDRLFYREAGGNAEGPFARFGVAFFEMAGHKVAPATIVRAIKEKPRSRKRPCLRLVHRAA